MKSIILFGFLFFIAAPAKVNDEDVAHDLAERMMNAMGGADTFNQIRYLRFEFEVEVDGNTVYTARHLRDRRTGRYREEWDLFGKKAQVLFHVDTKEGQAYREGERVDAAGSAEILEQAYYNHLNESYWLLMPWKMADPSVHLSTLGRKIVDDKPYDVLHLSFDAGVGESPGDQHWVFINPETGLIDQTGYFLERFEKNDPSLEEATIWAWSDWVTTGSVRFARDRRVLKSVHDPFETAHARFTVLTGLDQVDDAAFESLAVPMPER